MDPVRQFHMVSRRSLLAGAGAMAAVASVAPGFMLKAAGAEEARNAVPPEKALARLVAGNDRYARGKPQQQSSQSGKENEAQARAPIAAILACSDNRVPPEIIFDQGPGDLFSIRDAGNVVNDYTLAGAEFAVRYLGVPLVIVLGHRGCGIVATALGAATSRKELPGHLPEIVKAIEPAIIAAHGRHPSDFLAASIEENVRLGIKRLKTKSKIIGEAVGAGKAIVKGGIYDHEAGTVRLL